MNRRTFFHILVCTGALWLSAMPLFAQSNPTKDTTTVLIIGANGSVAKEAIAMFLQKTDVNLKLFLRNAMRLEHLKSSRVEVVEGDATDKVALTNAMKGVQVVYANLHGKNTPQMAATIIESMQAVGLKRLIWITSFGVYNEEYQEIPDSELARIANYIVPHKEEVRVIEASNLDYTIIRAQWFSHADEIDYELTQKGEAFNNPSGRISRKSIADLILRLCTTPNFGIRQSLGINKPL